MNKRIALVITIIAITVLQYGACTPFDDMNPAIDWVRFWSILHFAPYHSLSDAVDFLGTSSLTLKFCF
jgi:hypothetical protein